MKALLTWVGAHDPTWKSDDGQLEMGPILLLLTECPFDVVYLLFNPYSRNDNFVRRTVELAEICRRKLLKLRVVQKTVDLVSVTDYQEIYEKTNDVCQDILGEQGQAGREYFVYLSPGTPQMQTVWILLVQSGLLPAKMLYATHRRDREEGAPIYREANLSTPDLPQVVSPDKTARVVSLLQTENRNLKERTEELERQLNVLQADKELVRIGGELSGKEWRFTEGFKLKGYMTAEEKALYLRAYKQAGGKVPKAAQLLGVKEHTFRERAETFGIRDRRRVNKEEDA